MGREWWKVLWIRRAVPERFYTTTGLASPTPSPDRFNDILQLGADYQGGAEDICQSVKIKIEPGRECQASSNVFKYVPFDSLPFFSYLARIL